MQWDKQCLNKISICHQVKPLLSHPPKSDLEISRSNDLSLPVLGLYTELPTCLRGNRVAWWPNDRFIFLDPCKDISSKHLEFFLMQTKHFQLVNYKKKLYSYPQTPYDIHKPYIACTTPK